MVFLVTFEIIFHILTSQQKIDLIHLSDHNVVFIKWYKVEIGIVILYPHGQMQLPVTTVLKKFFIFFTSS